MLFSGCGGVPESWNYRNANLARAPLPSELRPKDKNNLQPSAVCAETNPLRRPSPWLPASFVRPYGDISHPQTASLNRCSSASPVLPRTKYKAASRLLGRKPTSLGFAIASTTLRGEMLWVCRLSPHFYLRKMHCPVVALEAGTQREPCGQPFDQHFITTFGPLRVTIPAS